MLTPRVGFSEEGLDSHTNQATAGGKGRNMKGIRAIVLAIKVSIVLLSLLPQKAHAQESAPDEPFGLGFSYKLWAPSYPCGLAYGANIYANITKHIMLSADVDGCGTRRYSYIDRNDTATGNIGIAPWGTAQLKGLAPVFIFGYGGRLVAVESDVDGPPVEARQRVVRAGLLFRQRSGKGNTEGALTITAVQVTVPVATERASKQRTDDVKAPRVFRAPEVLILQIHLSVGPKFD